jgi:hypothetical protein
MGLSQQFIGMQNIIDISGFASGTYGSGVSLYDWNKDGYDDITLLGTGVPPKFYLNTGGQFQEVFFNGIQIANEIKSVTWIDMNNDGFPDLAFNSFNGGLKLYKNNGDFTFSDFTSSAGVVESDTDWGFGISWADYDTDGYLDLFVANYNSDWGQPGPNHLYHNNGDFTFNDVTAQLGIDTSNAATFMGIWFDYNNDNLVDLLVLNDRVLYQNFLYKNIGNGQFLDVSQESGSNVYMDPMSGTIGDFNNDGWFDYYVTNTPTNGNKLFRNSINGTFVDVGAGLNSRIFQWCWGATWVDYNNDTFQDLFVVSQPYTGNGSIGNHYLLKNTGSTFDWQVSAGFAGSTGATFATARGDFNNDGHPDLITHSFAPLGVEVWYNQIQTGNYLKVALEGVLSNRDGIGAKITAYTGTTKQARFTLCGEQYISQNSQWQHFGFGSISTIDSLVVLWPSGHIDKFFGVNTNQSLRIKEGSSITNQISVVSGNVQFCPGDSIILDGGNWSTHNWSTGQSTRYISIHQSETVSLIVTNQVGVEIVSDTLVISASIVPQYAVEIDMPLCFDNNNGGIQILADSSQNINSVVWNTNQTGTSVSGLNAGVYSLMMNYGFGCSLVDTIELHNPPEIQLTEIVSSIQSEVNSECPSTYSITANAIGGSGGYIFNWEFYLGNNSSPFLIETGDTIHCIPTNDIRVACKVIDSKFCTDSLSAHLDLVLGFDSNINQFYVFPNPFNDILTVQSSCVLKKLTLLDLSGKELFVKSDIQNTFVNLMDTQELKSGLYLLKIESEFGVTYKKVQKK